MSFKNIKKLDWDLENARTDLYTSNIHPYHAKFIPQIPSRFIDEYTEERDTVLDPFNGSGTTTMLSSVKNRNSYGYDLNPLSCLIARVKSYNYDIKNIKDSKNKIFEDIKKEEEKIDKNEKLDEFGKINYEGLELYIPDFNDKYQWYTPSVLNKMGLIFNKIMSIEEKKIRQLFKVVFSSITKKLSMINRRYAYIGDNMYPTRDTNKLEPDRTNHKVSEVFNNKLEDTIEKIERLPDNIQEPKIINKPSNIMSELDDDSVDLIVTSPPYPNAVDYARYHRLSFYWLEYDISDTRDKETGARSKRGRKNSVEDYFEEVEEIYKECSVKSKEGGIIAVVVGNSQKNKEKIDVIGNTEKILKNSGYSKIGSISRNLSNQTTASKSITEESILVYKY